MLFHRNSLIVRSHAKINLSLRILGSLADGFHDLEMVNLPLELHDVIEVSKAPYSIDTFVTCDDASLDFSRHNLCTKAICKLREAFGFKDNFVVNIHKEIPFAAGLGGGSSNAAAVMKAIVNILQLKADDEMLNEIGLQIGADVPFFLKMHPSIVTGIGEKLQPIPVAKSFLCLLVKPVKGLSTKKVFETYDERKPENLQIDTKKIVEALAAGDEETLAHTIGNDLQSTSSFLLPDISEIVDSLRFDGFKIVSMSGSGSTVFALTSNPKLAKEAHRKYEGLGYVTRLTKTLV